MGIKKFILDLGIVKYLFEQREYLEIGTRQLNFILSKLTILMSVSYLAEKYLKINFTLKQVILLVLLGVTILWLIGFLYKKAGIWGFEIYTVSGMNPVEVEKLKAARIIIEAHEKVKK